MKAMWFEMWFKCDKKVVYYGYNVGEYYEMSKLKKLKMVEKIQNQSLWCEKSEKLVCKVLDKDLNNERGFARCQK